MKYKVGDRVWIKDDISRHPYRDLGGNMCKWQGKVMTIRSTCNGHYKMEEDVDELYITGSPEGWQWYEDMIAGPAGPKMTNTEILTLAIATYGIKKQVAVCIEEMSELTKALIKLYRAEDREEKKAARDNVQEEIADAKIMLQQMSMIFGEKKIAEIQEQKIERLRVNTEDERPAEIVIGEHKRGGKNYIWQNPKGYHVEVGGVAMAETKYGEYPIIIKEITTEKKKYTKQHRCITGGIRA